ncbi:glutaredoxin-1-like [Limulus polyphemus]|uniref:Glutaredoxin-1 n=1 Tax=Limulus polyphemus TaxID=6850 RepID=A0ABM1BRE5_LIMPO|nr:glutaredoxin-1-like [Limulus polyphemus]
MGSIIGKSEAMSDEEIKTFVTSKINSKKVVIFSKSYCPYCKNAKKIFLKYNMFPEFLDITDIENREDCQKIQSYLREITGASSVPRVFINGKCIGGADETEALNMSGQLEILLRDCGAIN